MCRAQDMSRGAVGFYAYSLESFESDYRRAAGSLLHLSGRPTLVHVIPGSPAAIAGLQVGDEIRAVGGHDIRSGSSSIQQMQNLMATASEDGGDVRLTVYRTSDRSLEVSVRPESACVGNMNVLNDPSLNAFADGHDIYITSGMMRFLQSDDMLAVVVGHELAHNTQKHLDSRRSNALLGTLLDLFAASRGVNTQGQFGQTGAMVYSQEFESEADYVGLYMAYRGGYDISDAPDLWREMVAETGGGSIDNAGFGQAHPSTPERFIALQNTVDEIEQKVAVSRALIPNGIDMPAASYRDSAPLVARYRESRGSNAGTAAFSGMANRRGPNATVLDIDNHTGTDRAGSGEAEYELGLKYWDGDGVERDRVRALQLMRESSEMGYQPARNFVAEISRLLSEDDG